MSAKKVLLITACLIVVVMLVTIIFLPNNLKPKTNNTSTHLTPTPQSSSSVSEFKANFSEQNNSKITGETTFKEVNGKVFVGVVLQNADSKIAYPAYIFTGKCTDEKSSAKYSLSPVENGKTTNYMNKTMADFKKELPLTVKVFDPNANPEKILSCADLN